jgi:hypothetical protein
MVPFQYRPLESPTIFRLVRVPATKGRFWFEELQLNLIHTEMSLVKQQYAALSYVWGNPARVNDIKIDGEDFKVTDSVMYFLHRFREEPMLFWIDAICIDQDNGFEKMIQVPLMREIYESAQYIHVELGPGSDEEEKVFGELGKMTHAFEEEYEKRFSSSGKVHLPSCHLPHVYPTYNPKFWIAIDSILRNPWWYRGWILQEGTTATDTVFHLGNASPSHRLHMEGLAAYLDILTYHEPWSKTDPPSESPVTSRGAFRRFTKILNRRHLESDISLRDILEYFRVVLVTKPQDRLFSALSLADDIPPGTFPAVYEKSLPELYKDVVMYYINHSDVPLDVLGPCEAKLEAASLPSDFSSWVPQWNEFSPTTFFHKTTFCPAGTRTNLYNASRVAAGEQEVLQMSRTPTVNGSTLAVFGIQIGSLSTVLELTDASVYQNTAEVVNEWVPTDFDSVYAFTQETKLEAFLRTMVADLEGLERVTNPRRGGKAEWDSERHCLATGADDRDVRVSCIYTRNRRFAYTEQGYMCLVSAQAQVGDIVFVLAGGSMPFVLRSHGCDYFLVGECYVHGLMDGEALDFLKDGRAKGKEVRIV